MVEAMRAMIAGGIVSTATRHRGGCARNRGRPAIRVKDSRLWSRTRSRRRSRRSLIMERANRARNARRAGRSSC